MTRSRLALGAILIAAALSGCGSKSQEAVLASAQEKIDKGDPRTAVVELKAVLQKGPDTGAVRLMLGKALLRAGDAVSAAIELQKAVELDHPKEEVVPFLADALVLSGQWKKATDTLGSTVLADPKQQANLLATLAVGYMSQGQIPKARQSVAAALALNPKQLGAKITQARLLAGEGKIDDALQAVDSVLAEEPKAREARRLKGELLWIGKNDSKAAMEVFRGMLEIDKANPAAYAAINGIHLQQGDVEGLRKDVEAMKAVLPRDRSTKFYQARLALLDKDYKTARELTAELLKAAPEDIRLLGLAGLVEFTSGSLVVAESHLAKATQLSPQQSDLRQLLVQTYLRLGQNGKAIETLQPLISGDSVQPQILALAAEAYMQTGNTEAAETYFRRAAKARPEDVRIKTALALVEISRGDTAGFAQLESMSASTQEGFVDLALLSARLRASDLEGAAKAAQSLMAKQPKAALPAHLLGDVRLKQKKPADARASYEKAVANDPAYFPSIAALARLDLQDQKPDAAKARIQAVLTANPKHAEALIALLELQSATGTPPAEIRTRLEEAIKANPTEPRLRAQLIDLLLAQRDAKTAIAVARDASSALPGQLAIMDALARAQLASGEPQQALATFRKIVEARPNAPEPYMRLATAHLQNKDVTAATQNFRRALEMKPDFLPAQVGLMQVALREGKGTDALAVARQVQKQRPAESAGYAMEGEIHLVEKRWPAAIAAYRTALQRQPVTENAIKLHSTLKVSGASADADRFASTWTAEHPKDAHFRFHLGMFALSTNDFEKAEQHFRSVIALEPNRSAAYNNLAYALLAARKPGALAMAEQADKLSPNSPMIQDTLAQALLAENQAAKALDLQKKVVATDPEVAAYRLTLAKALLKSGDKAAARTELDKLAWLGDKFPGQKEVAALINQAQ